MEHVIFPFVRDFFTNLGIVINTLTVDQIGEDLNIRIETSDSPLLIGIHGKNIESVQHLLGRMIEQRLKEPLRVHLEVNDYMKLKDEKLFRFLDSKIHLAMSTGQSISMPHLTPYERKKAHSYVADKQIPELHTQSEGEGVDRTLVISYSGIIKTESPHKDTDATPSTLNNISYDGVGI